MPRREIILKTTKTLLPPLVDHYQVMLKDYLTKTPFPLPLITGQYCCSA